MQVLSKSAKKWNKLSKNKNVSLKKEGMLALTNKRTILQTLPIIVKEWNKITLKKSSKCERVQQCNYRKGEVICKICWSELINETNFTEREHGMREKCIDPSSNSDKKPYLPGVFKRRTNWKWITQRKHG